MSVNRGRNGRWARLGAMVALIGACSLLVVGTGATAGAEPFNPAPQISTFGPSGDGQQPNVQVTVDFTEDVYGVSGNTFALRVGTNVTTGPALSAEITRGRTRTDWILNPRNDLAGSTTYTLILARGPALIRDFAGKALVTKVWTFTTAPFDPRVPDAPALGTATAGDGFAVVNWTAPAPNAPHVDFYEVTAYSEGRSIRSDNQISPNATSMTFWGLTNGITYSFDLFAANSNGYGDRSAVSNNVTPRGPPPVVTATSPAAGATGVARNTSVTVDFSTGVHAVDGYSFVLRLGDHVIAGPGVSTVLSRSRPISAAQWTLDPRSDLAADTTYTVLLVGNSPQKIRSLREGLLATTSWTFTTGA